MDAAVLEYTTASPGEGDGRDGDVNEVLGKAERKSQFVLLRAKGFSYGKIANELGMAKSTLWNWGQELRDQIADAKALELEALQEEYYLLKEGRIQLLGGQLKAIQQEIGQRDLASVSTERLLELQLRYFGELKGEYVETSATNETGTRLNSQQITNRLQDVLKRFRAGEIGESQARSEQTILQSMLKAIEQTELEIRLERLEALLKSR